MTGFSTQGRKDAKAQRDNRWLRFVEIGIDLVHGAPLVVTGPDRHETACWRRVIERALIHGFDPRPATAKVQMEISVIFKLSLRLCVKWAGGGNL